LLSTPLNIWLPYNFYKQHDCYIFSYRLRKLREIHTFKAWLLALSKPGRTFKFHSIIQLLYGNLPTATLLASTEAWQDGGECGHTFEAAVRTLLRKCSNIC
jgi:hypothetical protein